MFRVNGKPILIRGAGWSQDMLLRTDEQRLRDQINMVRDMHLNTIRLEGKLETEDFFRLADEQGILVHARLVLLRSLGKMEGLDAEELPLPRPHCARRCCASASTPACWCG